MPKFPAFVLDVGGETSVTFAATATDGHSESSRDVSATALRARVCV